MTDLFTNKNLSAVFIKKLCIISYILVSISIWGNNNDSISVDQDKPQAELYISEDVVVSGLDFISNTKIYELKTKTNPNDKASESKKRDKKSAQINKEHTKKTSVVKPIKIDFKINQDYSLTFSSISYWSSYFVQPVPQQLTGNIESYNLLSRSKTHHENLTIIHFCNSRKYELIKGAFSVRPPPSTC